MSTLEMLLIQVSEKLDSLQKRMDAIEFSSEERQSRREDYPKRIMKKSELKKLGFTEDYLMAVYRQHNQKVAWKLSDAPNSTIFFDTTELEKLRQKQCGRR